MIAQNNMFCNAPPSKKKMGFGNRFWIMSRKVGEQFGLYTTMFPEIEYVFFTFFISNFFFIFQSFRLIV